jgi:proprotein convertase subtilisin/kexin type 5
MYIFLACSINIPNYFMYNNNCLLDCPESTFKNITNETCDLCDITCGECSGPLSTDCTKCFAPNYFKSGILCVQTCPNGTYINIYIYIIK